MNWTEGALARHSRGVHEDLARQKAYFARARSGGNETMKPDVSTISFFQQPPPNSAAHSQKSSKGYNVLSSLHSKRQLSQHSAQNGYGSSAASSQLQRSGHPFANGLARSRHLSPAVHSGKRQRPADKTNTFDAKRRKMLQKEDWAGLRMQESLPIQFPAHESRKGQVWNFQSNKFTKEHIPFADRYGRATSRRLLPKYGSTQDRNLSVHIRIGSECLRSEASSQHFSSSPCRRVSTKRSTSNGIRKLNDRKQSRSKEDSRRLLPRPSRQLHCDETMLGAIQGDNVVPMERLSPGHQRRITGTYEGAVERMIPSKPYEISRHFRRDDQSLRVETSPSVIHHPMPRRIVGDGLLRVLRYDNESTAVEIGLHVNPKSSASKDDDWQAILAKTKGHGELTQQPCLVECAGRLGIGPDMSGVPVVKSDFSSLRSDAIDSFECQHQSNFAEVGESSSCSGLVCGLRTEDPLVSTSTEAKDLAANSQEPTADDTSLAAVGDCSVNVAQKANFFSKCPDLAIQASSLVQYASESILPDYLTPGCIDSERELVAEEQALRYTNSNDSHQRLVADENLSRNAPSSDEDIFDPKAEHTKQNEGLKMDTGDVLIDKEMSASITVQTSNPEISLLSQQSESAEEPLAAEPVVQRKLEADWMKFLFPSDIEDAQETAFQKAAQDAARVTRPSSGASERSNFVPEASNPSQDTETVAATCGTSVSQRQAMRKAFIFSPDPHFNHPADRTPFPPSFSPDSDLGPPYGPRQAQHESNTAQLNGPGASFLHFRQTHHTARDPSPISSSSSAASAWGFATDAASITAQPPISESGGEITFIFTQPKNFVGRLAKSSIRPATQLPPVKMPRSRARPKKSRKNRDGRADIRALPNYDEDPIESDE